MSSAAIQRSLAAGPISAAVATAQIFPVLNASPISQPLVPCILNCSGSLRLEQKRFKVRASGDLTTAGAFTAFPSLFGALVQPANPFTPASWSLLAAGTAAAVGTTSCGWLIEAELLFDSLSGKLQGEFETNVNNIFVAKAAISNPLTAVIGANEPVMVFAVGLTFSTGSAANSGRLADFCLDA
jgi:hypothetical protein